MFLRTSEFLWQEGHCAHATHKESLETVLWALEAYQKTYNELMSIYGIAGVKSDSEKFAGADKTFTFEILMPDGKALQGCTSHDLGQNFAKAFDWTLPDRDGNKLHPWQNSWGLSTRSIGGLIMVCGDDNGLILPPKISPTQIVIIPIFNDSNKSKVINYALKIKEALKVFRVELDLIKDETVGFKFNKWELRGVPLRIEIGKKELKDNTITLVRRDTGEKWFVGLPETDTKTEKLLNLVQKELFERHKNFTEENTHLINSYKEFKEIMKTKRGFIKAMWCGNPDCEEKIKEETKASTRCLPLSARKEVGKCIYCGKKAKYRWLFAQAY